VPVYILSCSETPDNIRQILMLGSAYNDVDHFSTAESFPDRMLALRREYEAAQALPTESDRKAKTKTFRRAYGQIWGYAEATMGTHLSMIARPDEQWTFLARYLDGEHLRNLAIKKNKSKRANLKEVRSWAYLNQTASLNEANFAKLMNEILSADLPMSHVVSRIKKMLADQYIRGKLLEYFGFQTWEEFKTAYPNVATPAALESWSNMIIPATGTKFTLPKVISQAWECIKDNKDREFAALKVLVDFSFCSV